MLSAIRRRLHFSPAMVIAGLALVFAMSGGAYAAKKYLITSTKQISPKVLKQLQGKAGLAGAPGVAGAQGVQGPAGPAGPAGAGGAKGETGPAGARGEKGVTGAAGAKGATGASGATGYTETLPSGKTETGTWSIYTQFVEPAFPGTLASISFAIPLKGASEGTAYVFDLQETENEEYERVIDSVKKPTGCTGSVTEPTAPRGVLCVYTANETLEGIEGQLEAHLRPAEVEGYASSGAFLGGLGANRASARIEVSGTWAVTAP
jgi:hypothetical protein